MSLLKSRKDKYGQELRAGDICVRSNRGKPEFVCYEKHSWGGGGSRGEYGRFITPQGDRISIKYTSVAFAFEPISKRRASGEEVSKLIKQYYEGK